MKFIISHYFIHVAERFNHVWTILYKESIFLQWSKDVLPLSLQSSCGTSSLSAGSPTSRGTAALGHFQACFQDIFWHEKSKIHQTFCFYSRHKRQQPERGSMPPCMQTAGGISAVGSRRQRLRHEGRGAGAGRESVRRISLTDGGTATHFPPFNNALNGGYIENRWLKMVTLSTMYRYWLKSGP